MMIQGNHNTNMQHCCKISKLVISNQWTVVSSQWLVTSPEGNSPEGMSPEGMSPEENLELGGKK